MRVADGRLKTALAQVVGAPWRRCTVVLIVDDHAVRATLAEGHAACAVDEAKERGDNDTTSAVR